MLVISMKTRQQKKFKSAVKFLDICVRFFNHWIIYTKNTYLCLSEKENWCSSKTDFERNYKKLM